MWCLLYRPVSAKPGPRVDPPFTEVWKNMENLVGEGLVKSIGLSNFSPQKIESFISDVKIRPAVNQVCLYACSTMLTSPVTVLFAVGLVVWTCFVQADALLSGHQRLCIVQDISSSLPKDRMIQLCLGIANWDCFTQCELFTGVSCLCVFRWRCTLSGGMTEC